MKKAFLFLILFLGSTLPLFSAITAAESEARVLEARLMRPPIRYLKWVGGETMPAEFVGPARPATFAGDVTASSCERADWVIAVAAAANGDTLIIPPGDCIWTGTTTLSITKALEIRGLETCSLAANSLGDMVPNDCSTNIISNFGTDSTSLITWTFPTAFPFNNTISEMKFSPGTDTGSSNAAFISITCSTISTTTLRAFHLMNDGWEGRFITFNNCAGVADHNYVDSSPQQAFYVAANNFYGPANEAPTAPDFGDASWFYPAAPGQPSAGQVSVHGYPSAIYIEHNTILGGARACVDGASGGRYVFRYNVADQCDPAHHGTDSTARQRSLRFAESYRNMMVKNGSSIQQMYEDRDAPVFVFQNETDYSPAIASVRMNNYRAVEFDPPWGPADGTGRLDENDPANPYDTGTSTGGSSTTLVDTSQVWSSNQWAGYVLRMLTRNGDGTQCANLISVETACYAPIVSSTACPGTCTLTFVNGENITVSANDQYQINKIIRTIDQPGRTGGSKLQATTCTGTGNEFTMASGIVTVINCAGHNMSTGDYMIPDIQTATCGSNNARDWAVPSQVTVLSSSSFTYAYPYGLSSSLSCASNGGDITKIPADWNDQEDYPTLAWLNTNNGANAVIALGHGTTHVLGETYADYTASFTGATGTIGSGARASRSATCAVGSYYWATNGGGDWNTEGDDGALDKCVSANMWEDDWYVPYTNPHPLVASSSSLSFTVQPVKVHTGNVMSSFAVSVMSGGVVDTSSSASITLTLSNCANASISGTLTVAASSGVATFNNVTGSGNGAFCQLVATDDAGLITSGTSSAFGIGPNQLAFTVQPSATYTSGTTFDVTVAAQFASDGSTDTDADNPVTIALVANPDSSGALSGSVTQSLSSGVRAFSLTISGAGIFLASAAASGLQTVGSDIFNVTGDALAFTVQPPISVSAGQPMSVTVTVRYPNLATDTSVTNTVTLSVNSGACIISAPSVNPVAGIATFSNVVIVSGSGSCQLGAAAFNVTSGLSDSFNISGTPPVITTTGRPRFRGRFR